MPAEDARVPYAGALSLRENFTWTFVGNAIYMACQWGMLVVLAKLTPPEIVGQFALGLAISSPVITFANLHLRGVIATDARESFSLGEYVALRLATTCAALLFLSIAIACLRESSTIRLVLMCVGLAKGVESLSDLLYGRLQHHERMDAMAISMTSKGLLSLGALYLGLAWSGRLLGGLLGMLAAWAMVLFLYDVRVVGKHESNGIAAMRPRWQRGRTLKLVKLALPLGFVMLIGSLTPNMPRYALQQAWGTKAVGIYTACSYMMFAGSSIVGALGQASTPSLARWFAAGNYLQFRNRVTRLTRVGLGLGVAGLVVALLWGRPLLALLYRPEYAVATTAFIWLMAAAAAGHVSSFYGYALTAARSFKPQAALAAVVAVATGACAWLLVPRLGITGAAVALFIGSATQLAGCQIILRRLMAHVPRT